MKNVDGVCEDGVSGGELVGIIAGAAGGAVVLVGVGVFLWRRRKSKGESLLNS